MTTTSITPEGLDQFGRFFVVTRTFTGDQVTGVNRRQVQPGAFTDATTFVPTDTSNEAPAIQAFVAQQWTPQVVAAFQAAEAR